MIRRAGALLAALTLCAHGQALGQQHQGGPTDFTTYSLEELMSMELVTAAKKPQKTSESAAAVFVITQEDIRRSGAVTLPEALRMAPGLQVLRAGPGNFAVSSRGFLGKFANKMLIMVDGRSIYSPTYSGVFWSYNDMLLENIKRIEVIRGPGATLWGANAVNGVINIITKNARDMQGGMAVGAHSADEGYQGLRYGARLKEGMYLTAYGKYIHFGNVINEKFDDRRDKHAGFRLDWNMTDRDTLFVSAQYFDADEGGQVSRPIVAPPLVSADIDNEARSTGGHVVSRWDHTFSPTSAMALQVYVWSVFNRGERSTGCLPARRSSALRDDVSRETIADIDFQHSFALGARNSIVWGLNVRYAKAHKQDRNIFYTLRNETERQRLYSFFVQDDIALLPGRLSLIVGSKFEYNSYTQLEVQPGIRLLYTPSGGQALWGAVSRAVRMPSFLESGGRLPTAFIRRGSLFPLSPPGIAELQGSTDFAAEDLIAFEFGHRVQLGDGLSLDSAFFYNLYSDLRTFEPGTPQLKRGYFVVPLKADNKMGGRTYGAEFAATWQVLPRWRLQATYAYLRMNLMPETSSGDTMSEYDEDLSPESTVTLRSQYSITPSLECDIGLYFMSRNKRLNTPSHTDLTVRIGWKPLKNLTLEGIAANLVDNKYDAFTDDFYDRGNSKVRRAFYGRITIEF